jgi:hypothetical protein
MKNFLNTMAGSWLKVFAVAVLVKFLDLGGDIFALNIEALKHLIQAGVVAAIPVVINYLNGGDKRYGNKDESNAS